MYPTGALPLLAVGERTWCVCSERLQGHCKADNHYIVKKLEHHALEKDRPELRRNNSVTELFKHPCKEKWASGTKFKL